MTNRRNLPPDFRSERKRELNQKIRSWSLALGCLMLVSLYPCLFQYSLNLPESRLADAAVFWGIFAGIGLLAFLVCLAILRRIEAAGFLATLCLLAAMNFGLLKTGVQNWLPWLPGGILLGGLCAGAAGNRRAASGEEMALSCSTGAAHDDVWRIVPCQRGYGGAKAGKARGKTAGAGTNAGTMEAGSRSTQRLPVPL